MRKVAMAIVVLALAGCGEGKPVEAPKAKPAVTENQPQAGAIAAQEWDVWVGPPDHKLQAITDLTAWLLEHGFNFYMSKQYGLRLSKQDRQLYEAWDKTYPVQHWERQRNQTVACVMGRGNEFVGPVNLKACG